ncbi:MAG: aldehyde dehydrogenase family protein [Acidimicrobiales bacterium]
MGGDDPAIVLDDVDPDEVGAALLENAFGNCGQVCVAIKRVYVTDRVLGAIVDALADRARAAKVGAGMLKGTEIGSLVNEWQRNRVAELVSDARANGARVAAGGGPLDGPGYFFEPTMLAGVDAGVRIVNEEQFGPVLPIIGYRDIGDAGKRANSSHFGLGGSVWSRNVERATAIATRLETGTAWVNFHRKGVPGQPSGGMKWSGIGVKGDIGACSPTRRPSPCMWRSAELRCRASDAKRTAGRPSAFAQ